MEFKVKLDTSPWRRKRDRMGAAVRNAPQVVIEAPGQEEKILAAMERGDELDTSEDADRVVNALLAEGVAELMNNPRRTSLRETMDQIGEYVVEDLAAQIVAGEVTGPPRSDAWIRKKGHDVNLLHTGDLAGSLRHRLK